MTKNVVTSLQTDLTSSVSEFSYVHCICGTFQFEAVYQVLRCYLKGSQCYRKKKLRGQTHPSPSHLEGQICQLQEVVKFGRGKLKEVLLCNAFLTLFHLSLKRLSLIYLYLSLQVHVSRSKHIRASFKMKFRNFRQCSILGIV